MVDYWRIPAADAFERPSGGILRIVEGACLDTDNEFVDGTGLERVARILGFIYLVWH